MNQASRPHPISRGRAVSAVVAARRFYLDGAGKSEIAAELGISRFKVARLIEAARRQGLVRIEVTEPADLDLELSAELAARHGLREVLVVRVSDASEEASRDQLGRTCADLLTERLEASDVLGISWGRTLHSMVAHLDRLPGCAVVQIVGSVPTLELAVNSIELVRRVADCAGGPVYPLHVPLLVDNPTMAGALRRDPHVNRTVQMFDRLTRAVVGIGAWTPGGSSIRPALPDDLALELDRSGAVADICSLVLDAEGREVRSEDLRDQFIAIRREQLRAVPDVIAVAGGAAKVPAIRAAVRSGLIHRLITDAEAARLLLAS